MEAGIAEAADKDLNDRCDALAKAGAGIAALAASLTDFIVGSSFFHMLHLLASGLSILSICFKVRCHLLILTWCPSPTLYTINGSLLDVLKIHVLTIWIDSFWKSALICQILRSTAWK